MLKKPFAVNFTKKNQIHPFEDQSNLQFFSQKNDASLFVIGTHSKKRPNTLTFARMFDHQLLDMMEVSIEHGVPMKDFKVQSPLSFTRSFSYSRPVVCGTRQRLI